MKYQIVKTEGFLSTNKKWVVQDTITHEVIYSSNLKKDCKAWIDSLNLDNTQQNKEPETKQVELVGIKIKDIRPMNKKELDSEGWDDHHPCQVIILENGIKLYPSMDYEGNGTGALFGDLHGNKFSI